MNGLLLIIALVGAIIPGAFAYRLDSFISRKQTSMHSTTAKFVRWAAYIYKDEDNNNQVCYKPVYEYRTYTGELRFYEGEESTQVKSNQLSVSKGYTPYKLAEGEEDIYPQISRPSIPICYDPHNPDEIFFPAAWMRHSYFVKPFITIITGVYIGLLIAIVGK